MECRYCYGMESEVGSGVFDEVLCTHCGQHYYKSTNHTGFWNTYVVSDCIECRTLPNTDGTDELEYKCYFCEKIYVWGRVTGWELARHE